MGSTSSTTLSSDPEPSSLACGLGGPACCIGLTRPNRAGSTRYDRTQSLLRSLDVVSRRRHIKSLNMPEVGTEDMDLVHLAIRARNMSGIIMPSRVSLPDYEHRVVLDLHSASPALDLWAAFWSRPSSGYGQHLLAMRGDIHAEGGCCFVRPRYAIKCAF